MIEGTIVSKIDLSFRVNCFHEAQCPHHPYQTQVPCALTDFFFNLERLLLAVDSNLPIYRSPKAAEEQPAWSLGVSGQSIITKPRARFQ